MIYYKKANLFFKQDADTVAIGLLGKILCHRVDNGKIIRLRILETEAYTKEDGNICYGNETNHKKNKSNIFYSIGKLCEYCSMLVVSCKSTDRPDNVLIRSGELVNEHGGSLLFEKPISLRNAFWQGNIIGESDLLIKTDVWIDDLEIQQCSYCSHKRVNVMSNRKFHFCLQEDE